MKFNIVKELKKLDDPSLTLDQANEMFQYACEAFNREAYLGKTSVFEYHQRIIEWTDLLDKICLKIDKLFDTKKESEEVCPDACKELEIYVKVGYMDPTVFVPVLVLEKGTKFVGKRITLEDALASDIVAKVKDIRDQAKHYGIPKVTVVLDRPSDAFIDYLIEKGVVDEYRYDKHFYDFFAELSQSEAIHSLFR